MTLLVAALVFFAAFHLLPGFDEQAGWRIWPNLGGLLSRLMKSPDSLLLGPTGAVAIASFLTFSLLIVASPFLTNVWRKSRLAWWIVVIFSGVTSAGFLVSILTQNPISELDTGAWCLLISPGLNFIGLLLARGKSPDAGFPPPGNDEPIA
jgi:hypothetical protein